MVSSINKVLLINYLTGYTDSDFVGCVEDRKSTSGYAFKYGNCLVSWNSSKQKTV